MTSLDALAAEATKGSEAAGSTPEEVEQKVQEALACPCIADLKDGPCGRPFVDAFACFLRRQGDARVRECMQQFTAMQECMKKNPDAFAEFAPQQQQ